jgi:hypothetical protein
MYFLQFGCFHFIFPTKYLIGYQQKFSAIYNDNSERSVENYIVSSFLHYGVFTDYKLPASDIVLKFVIFSYIQIQAAFKS